MSANPTSCNRPLPSSLATGTCRARSSAGCCATSSPTIRRSPTCSCKATSFHCIGEPRYKYAVIVNEQNIAAGLHRPGDSRGVVKDLQA